MLAVNINSNPNKIKKNVVAGMNMREVLFSFLALLITIIITAVGYFVFHIEMYIGVNVSILVCFPIMLQGFRQKNGITLREKIAVSRNKKKGGISYEANEHQAVIPVKNINETETEAEKQAEFQKTVKMMKLIGIVSAILLIAIGIVVILIFK